MARVRKALARSLRGLLAILGLLALLAAAALAGLQTRAGKDWLAGAVARAVSDDSITVSIGRIDGRLPFDLSVDAVTVGDADGTWLELERLAVEAEPLALARGVVHLRRLAVDQVRILRAPAAPAEPEPGPAAGFRAPLGVAVDRLALARIVVEAPVAGRKAVLAADGRIRLDAATGTLGAAVTVERRDGIEGRLALEADYRLDSAAFDARATLEEPPGGVLSGLLALPADADLHVAAEGGGTLDDWKGHIEARIGTLAAATAELSLAADPGGGRAVAIDAGGDLAGLAALYAPDLAEAAARVTLSARGMWQPDGAVRIDRLAIEGGDATIALAGLVEPEAAAARVSFEATLGALGAHLAPEVAALLGAPLAGELDGAQRDDGSVDLRKLLIAGSGVAIQGAGRIAPDFDAVAIDVALDIDNLAQLPPIIDAPLAGSMSVRARLDGKLDALAVQDAHVDVRNFATTDVALDSLAGVIGLAPATTWDDPALEIAFDGQGTVDNLRVAGAEAELAQLLGRRARWRLAGTAPVAGGRIALTRVLVAGEGLEADGTGAVVDGRRLDLALAVRAADLARLAPLAGIDIAGSLDADTRATVDLADGTVVADLSGRVRRFSTSVPGLAETVGAEAPLAARLAVDAAGGVRIDDLDIDGEGGRLSGSVALAGDTGALAGSLRLDVGDLGRYRALVGADITGRAAVAANLGGTDADPAIGASFSFAGLAVAGAPPLTGQGWLTGVGLAAAPSGRLGVSVRAGEVDLAVAADYALDDERLSLRAIEAHGPGVVAEGSLSLPLAGGAVAGTVSGRSDDLAPLAALAGVAAAGAIGFELSLAEEDGRQGVRLSAEAHDLTVADADLALDRLTLRADGTTETARIAVEAAGTAAGHPLKLAAAGRVTTAGGQVEVVAETLDGSLAGQAIALDSPATATIAPGAIEVALPAVTVAGGRIEVRFARTAENLGLRVVAQRLPLAAISREADGSIDAEVSVRGAAPTPEGSARLSVAALSFHDQVGGSLPPVELAAEARWAGGVVDAQATVTAFDGGSLAADLRFPLALSADSYAPLLADGALDGQITGTADVARIAPLFLGDLDRAAGKVDLALALTGTVEQPEVAGRLALANGTYENGTAGAVVRDFAVELVGDRRQVTLQRFSGNDGGAGTISGTGTVAIDPAAGFPHAMAFNFRNFTVVRREEGEVPVDGELTLTGSVDSLRLAGELTVPKAELRLPDSLPPEVVTLDVVEVGGARGTAAGEDGSARTVAEAGAPDQALALDLDMVIVMPGQVFVRGRGLTSEWRGRLAITGPAAEPLITGALELVRGSFDLLGKTLDLTQGSVRFDEDVANDPAIAALATADLADAVARIEISGRASAPEVRLASDPPLPEDEILARLLFGTQVGALTPLQAVQLANGLATLSGTGGAGIIDTVRSALGADILEVRSTGEDATAGSVRAGKYLTRDVMISVEQGTAQGSGKATLEVEVNKNITVETDVGADSQSSIGVNIKTDY